MYSRCSRATMSDASFLLAQGIDIVVAGDSMMRQHFTRLVQLLRGRQRNVDYRVHTHGSYSYCDEVYFISLTESHHQTVAQWRL